MASTSQTNSETIETPSAATQEEAIETESAVAESQEIPGSHIELDDDGGSDRDAQISIDTDSTDSDSAIGDLSIQRSTMSVRSSVYDYVEENGRTYHRYKEGSYIMPNDEQEQERLDMQHHLWLMTMNDQLHLAPVKENPQNVLDIGTGTGIWAIDYATKFPSAQVIGNDLSPIQPEFVPANCSFEVEDAEDEWTYSQKFDLIHGRLMVSCFKNPRTVFEHAFQNLAPGGYFEMQDADFPMKAVDNSLEDTDLWQWNQYICEGAAKAGRPWTNTKKYKGWMEEIGFEDIKETILYWPLNSWPRDKELKKLGIWFQHDLIEGLNSTKAILTRGLGWTNEQVEVFLVNVRKDIDNRKIHAYVQLRITYGRKPYIT